MDPKEKKVKEEELNVEETLNNCGRTTAGRTSGKCRPDDSRGGIGKGTGDGSGRRIEEQKDKYLRLVRRVRQLPETHYEGESGTDPERWRKEP